MPTFSPPTVADVGRIYAGRDHYAPVPTLSQRLFRYYEPLSRGRSVLKIGGVYQTIDTPSQDQINSATEVYLGGHIYEVDAATASALTAAGYVVT